MFIAMTPVECALRDGLIALDGANGGPGCAWFVAVVIVQHEAPLPPSGG